MKNVSLAAMIVLAIFFAGCEEEGEEGTTTAVTAADRGWHFPGRDCLACHNYDLQSERHLVTAGTLFKSQTVADVDDLANICNADLVMNFTDSGGNIVYSTADYYDPDSKGYKGQGNVFLLDRLFNASLNGTYNILIVEKSSGLTLAAGIDHEFNGGQYSIDSSVDDSNRLSCNACHQNGGETDPLYVQTNLNLCQ
ncbi:MAG: hypothetical protein PF439_07975 [Helicobacteraceae bacterium]|jgi:hypothetical protein|nr:hypothetical protein [Helicobacteraceae bacterium]